MFSLFYGSQLALRQGELRRVWAYGSLSHMGLILLGLAIASPAGVQAAIFQSLSHGLIPSLLFLLVSFFARWYGTTDIGEMAGLKSAFPVVAFLLYLGGFASPGLPGTSGFIGEFALLMAAFEQSPFLGGTATLSLLLTAAYVLRAMMAILYGPASAKNPGVLSRMDGFRRKVPPAADWVPGMVLAVLIIGFGLFPGPVID